MTFMAPMMGLIAAAAAVPLLVLMYLLKLRRTDQPVPSTLLWRRAVQDLQVNAPLQRLKKNLLLLLQLLALAAVLLAIARPVVKLDAGPARRQVLLIDRSASMSSVEDGYARLEQAKRQARECVEAMRGPGLLGAGKGADQAMVVAFDSAAKVMCNFTSDKRQLLAAIDAIEPGDGLSSLKEAMAVAGASAGPARDVAAGPKDLPLSIDLFSDGAVADAGQWTAPGEVRFHCIGQGQDNVAITAMQARRAYDEPENVEIFASLANYGSQAAQTQVQLSLDGQVAAVRTVQLPARKAATPKTPASPGKATITFSAKCAVAAAVEVRLLRPDELAADDAAWAILPPPRRLTCLLVTSGNMPLESALKSCPLARLDIKTPAEFDTLLAGSGELAAQYQVVLLDRVGPPKLPRGNYIVLGACPPDSGATLEAQLTQQVVVDWRSRHPVLSFVDLSNVVAMKALQLRLPPEAEVLAQFAKHPAIAVVRRHGSAYLLVSFDVLESNWPFDAGFVMFLFNATSYLGVDVNQAQDASLHPGQAITASLGQAGLKATLKGPQTSGQNLTADDSGTLQYGIEHVGLYTLTAPGQQPRRFAVSLLDEAESDIAPRSQLDVAGQNVSAAASAAPRGNIELWPMLVLAALVLACVEWLVYNSRARVG